MNLEPQETRWYRAFWRRNAMAWVIVEVSKVALLYEIWRTLRDVRP